MARTLAALHSVRPADVGLAGYGKLSGYNKRQVRMIVLCCAADTWFGVRKGRDCCCGKLLGRSKRQVGWVPLR